MKFSIAVAPFNVDWNVPVVFRGSLKNIIKNASMLDYNGIEIHSNNISTLNSNELITLTTQHNMEISTLGSGLIYNIDGLSFANSDKDERNEAVKRVIEFISFASRVKSKVIIGSVRGKLPNDLNKRSLALTWIRDCFNECIDQAEKLDVVLLVEAINRYETNFLNTVKEACDFIKTFSTDKLALHIDTFHMNIEEEDMCKTIYEFGKDIRHVHFADSNRYYPGRGHIDFKSILNALKDIGYNEYIALECLPKPNPDTVAREFIKYVQMYDGE